MLPLLLTRVALRTSAAASSLLKPRIVAVATRPLVSRTFLTTSQTLYPTKAPVDENTPVEKKARVKKTSAKKPAKKVAAKKKPTAKTKPAKKVVKPKKPAKPTKVVIRAEDKPPKRPLSAYLIFFSKFLAGQTTPAQSLEEGAKLVQEGAAIWRTLSDAEKQPFVEENKVLQEKYQVARRQYLSTVSADVIRELNRRSEKTGGRKIHRIKTASHGRPLTGFMRFVNDFRTTFTPTPGGDQSGAASAVAAGAKWRTMSDAEKEPYRSVATEALQAWRAERAEKKAAESS